MNGSGRRLILTATILAMILIVAAATAAGCGSQASAQNGPLKLTDADNGKTFEVEVGDEIQVALPGNMTTGYSWTSAMSETDAAVLQLQGEPVYKQESPDKSLVGGGGTFTFTFKAVAPGQASIKLEYARPWEEGVAPLQTYSVQVVVG